MSRSSYKDTICIRPECGHRRDNTQQPDNHTVSQLSISKDDFTNCEQIVKQAFANSMPQIMAIIWEEMEKLQRDTDNGTC